MLIALENSENSTGFDYLSRFKVTHYSVLFFYSTSNFHPKVVLQSLLSTEPVATYF